MAWKGEYHIKCPKCGCRKILVSEHCDAFSQHLIIDGKWDHDYDVNEYGDYTFTDFTCDSCKHSWRRHSTMDVYKKDSYLKKKVKNPFTKQINKLAKEANELTKKIKSLYDK